MKPLAETQARFLDALLGEGELPERQDIYRRNVLGNWHEALAAAYPVVRRLVGDAFFREAAERFARAHPSASGDLHRFGGEFAVFLETYEHARALPYLPDVARLEWAIAQAFHAAPARRLDFDALGRVREEERGGVSFRLQPAARLLASRHPVLGIWEANQPDRDGTLERDGEERVLVYREELTVRARRLDALEWRFLDAVAAGATLEEMAGDPAIGEALPAQLVQWTANGLVDDFAPPPRR